MNLDKLMFLYSTDRVAFKKELLNTNKENVVALLEELISNYFADVNNSTPRELVTLESAGFSKLEGKLGYDGYKVVDGNMIYAEVKPKNYSRTAKSPTKLNFSGNYTDFRVSKFEKYVLENPNIIVSGFVDGFLVYTIKFNFNNSLFQAKHKENLLKHFPEWKDVKGRWLRSSGWNHTNIDLENVEVIYFVRDAKFKSFVVDSVWDFLVENYQK